MSSVTFIKFISSLVNILLAAVQHLTVLCNDVYKMTNQVKNLFRIRTVINAGWTGNLVLLKNVMYVVSLRAKGAHNEIR